MLVMVELLRWLLMLLLLLRCLQRLLLLRLQSVRSYLIAGIHEG